MRKAFCSISIFSSFKTFFLCIINKQDSSPRLVRFFFSSFFFFQNLSFSSVQFSYWNKSQKKSRERKWRVFFPVLQFQCVAFLSWGKMKLLSMQREKPREVLFPADGIPKTFYLFLLPRVFSPFIHSKIFNPSYINPFK